MTRVPRFLSPVRVFIYSIIATLLFHGLQSLLAPSTSPAERGLAGSRSARAPVGPSGFLRDGANTPDGAKEGGRRADIVVNGTLPVLDAALSAVQRAYEAAFEATLAAATEQFEKRMGGDVLSRGHGVPGTSIETDEEAGYLQRYLDCVAANGRWEWDEDGGAIKTASGGVTVHKQSSTFASCDKRFYRGRTPGSEAGWDVRTSLKYRWRTAETCHELLPPSLLRLWQTKAERLADVPSRRSLCQLLRHKNILLVGDAATHYLVHDLFLDWTSDKPLTCYGDLFCNEHGICGGSLAEGAQGADDWEGDETVNERLPAPPGDLTSGSTPPLSLHLPPPPPRDVPPGEKRTFGTIVRYRRSDGMYLRSSPSSPGHDAQYIHPSTGIREINNYALADARRSDVVLLHKAPLPLPAVGSPFAEQTLALLEAHGEERIQLLMQLATKLTTEVWLPELLESLHALRAPPSPRDQLVIYRSGWRMSRSCSSSDATPPLPSSPPTLSDLLSATIELHVLLHDLQTTLQNHLLRTAILPRLGIPYLGVEAPLSIWQAGFVAGDRPPRNCLQTCLPSPGMALERAVIGGLHRIMAWGWASDGERAARWVGDDFVPVRVRTASRGKA